MSIAAESAVSLGKDSKEALTEWAQDLGLTCEQLVSEIHRQALPGIKKAISDSAAPDSNVVPIRPKR